MADRTMQMTGRTSHLLTNSETLVGRTKILADRTQTIAALISETDG